MASLHDAVGDHLRLTKALEIQDTCATVPNIANVALHSKVDVDVQSFNLAKAIPKHLDTAKDVANWFINTDHLCPEVLVSYFIDHMDVFEWWCVVICGANANDMDFSNSILLFLRKLHTIAIIDTISESDLKDLISKFAYKLYETHAKSRRMFGGNPAESGIMSLLKSIVDKKMFADLMFILLSTNKAKIEQIMTALTILDEHRDGHEDIENLPSKHLSEYLMFYRSYENVSKQNANDSVSGNSNGNDLNIIIDLYHILMNILQTYYQEEQKVISGRETGQITSVGPKSCLFCDELLLHKCWKVELFRSNETRKPYYCVLTPDAIYLLLQHQATDNSAATVVRKGTYYVHACVPLAVPITVSYSMDSFALTYSGKLPSVLSSTSSHLPQKESGIPVICFNATTKQVSEINYSSRLVFELTTLKAPPVASKSTSSSKASESVPYCCGSFDFDEADQPITTDVSMDWSDQIEELVQYNTFLCKEGMLF